MSTDYILMYEGDLTAERRALETMRRAAACDHGMDNFFLEIEADLPHHRQALTQTPTGGVGEPLAKRFKTSGGLTETMENVASTFESKCTDQQRSLLRRAIECCDVDLFLRLLSSALI